MLRTRSPRVASAAALLAALAVATAAGAAQPPTRPAAPPPAVYLLRPDRVFDGQTAEGHERWVVLVRGERIEAVGPAAQISTPAGTTMIDLPGTTLLPGLIDLHSHVLLHPYNETSWNDQVLRSPR